MFEMTKLLDQYDNNHDGQINESDCPYPYGTESAKSWWKTVMEPIAKAGATNAMKAKYGAKLNGAFEGKALVPGPGEDQGDFDYLVAKLQVTRGLSEESATRISIFCISVALFFHNKISSLNLLLTIFE